MTSPVSSTRWVAVFGTVLGVALVILAFVVLDTRNQEGETRDRIVTLERPTDEAVVDRLLRAVRALTDRERRAIQAVFAARTPQERSRAQQRLRRLEDRQRAELEREVQNVLRRDGTAPLPDVVVPGAERRADTPAERRNERDAQRRRDGVPVDEPPAGQPPPPADPAPAPAPQRPPPRRDESGSVEPSPGGAPQPAPSSPPPPEAEPASPRQPLVDLGLELELPPVQDVVRGVLRPRD